MIKAQILIETIDGSTYSYVNSFLKEKNGNDLAGNKKFAGVSGKYYMYTGYEGDTFEDQNEPGMLKADYEFLTTAILANGYLKLPETDSAAATSGNLIEELILPRDKEIGTSTAVSRVKLQTKFIKDVKIVETEVAYPFGRAKENELAVAPKTEEIYTIPSEVQKTYKRYVPLPIVKNGEVINFDDFTEVYYREPITRQFQNDWKELETKNINSEECEIYGAINEYSGGVVYYKNK